jgi:hypothetical protein
MFVLAIWLILFGLVDLVNLNIPSSDLLLAIIAIIAGVLIFLEIRAVPSKHIGRVLLAIWLVLTGLFALLSISFPSQGIVMAVLALASGVLLLLGR